ncbi:hypothetical protein PPYR_03912 [Photinus pyralis]|uniref:rRNA methyltransferase 2, mitochondrial n=1 Tax=Photinus pyralis TaxID=7054 RepID=A0A5N4AWN1_PHOPY|nr:rRNA methyltransferase 2, mitochondrial [Photinus pyralis]KAB0801726.1 hypothetical protein PPYR_03912 [Photinus pyralis]
MNKASCHTLLKRYLHTTTQRCKHVVPSNLKGKGSSSTKWVTRQLKDPYVEKAKILNYRCRSAFKLLEIDDSQHILTPGHVVVDCGAAPGSWTQVAVQRVNADLSTPHKPIGVVIAVDKQQIHPIPGAVVFGNCDLLSKATQDKVQNALHGKQADAVISDMAPSATGVKEMDDENILTLCYTVLRFAVLVSKIDASLLMKMWQSGFTSKLQKDMERFYDKVKIIKPISSRSDSAEIFLLGKHFKGIKPS